MARLTTPTCTLWKRPGNASIEPNDTTEANRSSLATSQRRATRTGSMPPPWSGSGARRVQSTPPLADGLPEATPSVNG